MKFEAIMKAIGGVGTILVGISGVMDAKNTYDKGREKLETLQANAERGAEELGLG